MGVKCLTIWLLIFFFYYSLVGQSKDDIYKGNIYYFSIGSYNYSYDYRNSDEGFESLIGFPPEVMSAKVFSNIFDSLGVKGRLIESSSSNFLSKNNIIDAFKSFLKGIEVVSLKNRNPIIFIYFFGHGMADNYHDQLYMIPGAFNIDYNNPYKTLKVEEQALTQNDFIKCLIEYEVEIRLVFLMDCCYSRSVQNIGEYKLDSMSKLKKADGTLVFPYNLDIKDGKGRARYTTLHSFNPHISIYAASPGSVVYPVEIPSIINENKIGGPICRRLKIYYDKNKSDKIFVANLLEGISDKNLDPKTNPPFKMDVTPISPVIYF